MYTYIYIYIYIYTYIYLCTQYILAVTHSQSIWYYPKTNQGFRLIWTLKRSEIRTLSTDSWVTHFRHPSVIELRIAGNSMKFIRSNNHVPWQVNIPQVSRIVSHLSKPCKGCSSHCWWHRMRKKLDDSAFISISTNHHESPWITVWNTNHHKFILWFLIEFLAIKGWDPPSTIEAKPAINFCSRSNVPWALCFPGRIYLTLSNCLSNDQC